MSNIVPLKGSGRPSLADGPSAEPALGLPMIKWNESFETGNTEIDSLHRHLVRHCSELLEMVTGGAAWSAIIAEADRLVASCIDHFRVEEAVLERMGFPRRDAHAAEHRRIEREMRALLARMAELDGSLPEHRSLPAALGPWLIDFIIRHDLDFRSHILHLQGR